jgi:tetratricopeptide (TPR) repeat protein
VHATTAPTWEALDDRLASPAGRADAMWDSTERVLQLVVGHPQLTGQALISEARRQQRLTLGDAHALIALHGWRERMQDQGSTGQEATSSVAPPGEDERGVAREAWLALEHAVETPSAGGGTYAPPAHAAATAAAPPVSRTASANASAEASAGSSDSAAADASSAGMEPRHRERPWYASPAVIVALIGVLVAVAAGGMYVVDRQRSQDYESGLAAYERGAREAARMAFARAAQDAPDDARPLIFLGRISREENDLPRARRFLEAAVRLDPENATAQRELASALLADGQPELARRFYVRAIERDPTDRLAQGFLGCALMRLGRYDEARRWGDRAGPGEWTPCLNAPFPQFPPMAPPVLAVPPR